MIAWFDRGDNSTVGPVWRPAVGYVVVAVATVVGQACYGPGADEEEDCQLGLPAAQVPPLRVGRFETHTPRRRRHNAWSGFV